MLVMAIKRPALLFLLASWLVFSGIGAAFCMDLTIASGVSAASPLSRTRTNRQEQLKPGPRKNIFGIAGKASRQERFRKVRITSYSLSGDPFFKRGGVPIGGEPRLGLATGVKGFGTALGEGMPGMPGMPPSASSLLSISNLSHAQDAAENAGIAFGCSKKSSLSSLEVSACYVHKVDKAWKTQTYVTKGLADSNPGWGGGLSVGYAY